MVAHDSRETNCIGYRLETSVIDSWLTVDGGCSNGPGVEGNSVRYHLSGGRGIGMSLDNTEKMDKDPSGLNVVVPGAQSHSRQTPAPPNNGPRQLWRYLTRNATPRDEPPSTWNRVGCFEPPSRLAGE